MPRFHHETRSTDDPFRTGTALQSARWLPATAVLVVVILAGHPRGTAAPTAAEPFAEQAGPGAIGYQRRPQLGPRPESRPREPAFRPTLDWDAQPVEVRGPEGMLVSVETPAGWSPLAPVPLRIPLVVGRPYRLRVGGIAGREGDELFPSIRVLGKLAVPEGMAWRFPVEVTIDADDLAAAADGALVRRVVYAACEPERPDVVPGGWFDVKPGHDALEVAATLGQPVAEVVIGNRLPAREAAR